MNVGARIVFANNLNSYLKKAGKNQSDLQEYIGCSASTVSDWCKGNKYPRPDKMQRISEFFGVLMSDLVNDRDHRLPNGAYEIDISKMTKIPIVYDSDMTADRIKKILIDKKLTVKQMVTACDLGVNALSNIRHGGVKSVDAFLKIADYLDCSIDYLLGRTDNKNIAR